MVGIQYDLTGTEAIYQGADWHKEFQLIDAATRLPYDLSTLEVRASARKKYTDANSTWDFDCAVIDLATATIRLAVSNANSANIAKGIYKYDVEMYSANDALVFKVITPSLVEVVEEYTK